VKRIPLSFAIAFAASLALGSSRDDRFAGTWPAVKITLTKNATKDQAAEESRLGFFSIELQPHHQATAQFVSPIDCRWKVEGSTLTLIPKVIKNSSPGESMTVRLPPILLKVSKDGKTLTRVFNGHIYTFAKEGKAG
jgi:hypothetical protein